MISASALRGVSKESTRRTPHLRRVVIDATARCGKAAQGSIGSVRRRRQRFSYPWPCGGRFRANPSTNRYRLARRPTTRPAQPAPRTRGRKTSRRRPPARQFKISTLFSHARRESSLAWIHTHHRVYTSGTAHSARTTGRSSRLEVTLHPLPAEALERNLVGCLLYTSPSPRDRQKSRMPSSA